MSQPSVIKAMNLSLEYGQLRALSDASMDIATGITGLLGPNGAGKSTFIKLVLGLLQPTSGALSVLGLNPSESPRKLRARIGYMPEGDSVMPHQNALQFVRLMAELSGLPRSAATARAHEILHLVGLGEARYRKLGSFSTGMKQRARLAGALTGSPELLLLDEPTSGLDPASRAEILELVTTLPSKADVSVMLSTHILSDVEATCENVVVLNEGQVRYQGQLASLLEPDKMHFEVRVKGSAESFAAALRAGGIDANTRGAVVDAQMPKGSDVRDVLRLSEQSGIQVRHAAPAKRSLEDAFLEKLAE